jgi:hypothetical protein
LAVVAAGAVNGAPGLRPPYHANYYAAFVIGPDGHNIEVVILTSGNVHDLAPALDLPAGPSGMTAGDKGYLSKQLAAEMKNSGLKMLTTRAKT